MYTKHFLKILVGFVGLLLLGIIGLFLINSYDPNNTGNPVNPVNLKAK